MQLLGAFVYLILPLLYIFCVYWIIPCYPSYRSLFRCSLSHYAMALLMTVLTFSFAYILCYERRYEMMIMLPLMLTVSYVDWRTQEIPQAPLSVFALAGIVSPDSNYVLALMFAGVLTVMALAGKIGFGDVELAGLWIMYLGKKALFGMCLSCVLCFAVMKIKKGSPDQKIPFAPYLCAGMAPMMFLPF